MIRTGSVPATDEAVVAGVAQRFSETDIPVARFVHEWQSYAAYEQKAAYKTLYPDYYRGNEQEKRYEHFIALQLLNMNHNSVFIDLASEHSPLPDIVQRLYNCEVFSQDIMFAPGINGRKIGGDACAMPVPDGFATHAALTCSLEHFEGDADTRLFRELARVVRPGGKVAIVPLYCFTEPAVQTDPLVSAELDIPWDREAFLYCSPGWTNRHARFYSAGTLIDRLVRPNPQFGFQVFRIDARVPGIYVRWALLAIRLI